MENDLICALIISLFISVGIRALAYIYIYIYMLKKLVCGKFSKSCGSLERKKEEVKEYFLTIAYSWHDGNSKSKV